MLLVLSATVGCGRGQLTQGSGPPSPEPAPKASALQALVGDYRLVDIDGDAVEAGSLSVVEGDDGVGVVYSATLGGKYQERKVLSPKTETEIGESEGNVHQKFVNGDHKTLVDYYPAAGSLTLEITECHPGICLSNVLTAEK